MILNHKGHEVHKGKSKERQFAHSSSNLGALSVLRGKKA